jgi:Methyltransferase domain
MQEYSAEQLMFTEILTHNQESVGNYFGTFFDYMRSSLVSGGSEFGLGITLFSLVVSTRSKRLIEIGRFKGFSTLCLASALKFLDIDWQEPAQHKQRPDINYQVFENSQKGKLLSIDPFPTEEAEKLIKETNLTEYVEFINARSDEVDIQGECDLIFIDGDHSYDGCKADTLLYVPWLLKQGGYFILHDYFGWYDDKGNNNSPVKKVIDEIIEEGICEQILIDTGYMSFSIFRKL